MLIGHMIVAKISRIVLRPNNPSTCQPNHLEPMSNVFSK